MTNLQLVKSRLEKTSISELPKVAARAGVPFGTLQKIKYGTTKNPSWETVEKMADFFRRKGAQ